MVMLPKGQSKGPAPSGTENPIGTYVQYEDDGSVILGVVTGTKKDKLLVFNTRGRELELGKGRLYFLPGRIDGAAATVAARTEKLSELEEGITKAADDVDVAELWAFVQDDKRVYMPPELSESYFGSDSIERQAGLRIALIRERMHFKRDKDGFEPRPAETVEELGKAEAAKQKKAAVRAATIEFLLQRVADPSAPVPLEFQDNLKIMAEVAAGVVHTDHARQKEGKDLVHLCAEGLKIPEAMPIEKRAFEVLKRIGYFHRDSNLSLIRHEIPTEFDSSIVEQARAIQVPESIEDFPEHERAIRMDLTRKESFTVDDFSTQDMDDAISVEQTLDGFELGIHITDVSWAVLPETDLDRVARRRATSVYAADRTINMLPEELSEQKLSLRQGVVRPCISVLVSVDREYQPVSTKIVPTFIRVARRLTYDEVDQLLEAGDTTLLTVNDIAAAREVARIRNGAVKVHKRDVIPWVESDGTVTLQEIDEDSPAHALVAEMMVFANSVIAEFGAEHGIPMLYRGQERPDDETQADTESAPEGPAKDFSARTKLKKSVTALTPLYHAGLGLSAYVQATSPIRRYIDLCHQRQLMSHFRYGKPWVSTEEFQQIAQDVEATLPPAMLASRETKRFWLLRYLEQRDKTAPLEATVVRLDLKSPLVELDEVYITVFARVTKPVKLGDRISVRVTSVDPHGDYLRIEMV